MDKLTQDKIIQIILDVLQVAKLGWVGVAAGGVALLGIGALLIWWKSVKDKAAEDETNRKREEDQANNADQNSKSEQDATKAADDIEEIIDADKRKK